MEWSHSVLGRFDISEEWIGLDFNKLFLDPVMANVTFFHEMSHAAMSRTTEMGAATNGIMRISPHFKHLDDDSTERLLAILVGSQKFPQEGFATFMGMQQLARATSRRQALSGKADLHPEYRDFFEKMEFMFSKSQQRRDKFTSQVSHLAMQTNFRHDAQTQDLLRTPEALAEYLAVPDNNPALRLGKILDTLRYNDHLVLKTPPEIAAAAGLAYFEPVTKQEVADFINYLYSLAGLEPTHKAEMVGNVDEANVMQTATESMLVTNINLNLKEDGIFVYKPEDIEFEAQHAQAAFMVYHTRDEKTDAYFEQMTGAKLEVAIIMFSGTGEKYLAVTSLEHARLLLVNQLSSATILTKWGICNPADSSFTISNQRKPDVILYNRPQDMLDTFKHFDGELQSLDRLFIGAMQDHPFQSLIVKINGQSTLHVCNGFGNAGINKIIEHIKPKSRVIELPELEQQADQLNDALSVMGLRWDVDWARTMISGTELVRR